VSFINAYRDRWGVEPICKVLQVAPSTYYAAVSRQPSVREQRDKELKVEIARVHRDNFGIYGVEKVWRQLKREGIQVGRDRVARLMDDLDLEGVVRGKRKPITTIATEVETRPDDLVERNFTASTPSSAGSSSAGASHARCTPRQRWTRWRWPSGDGDDAISPGSCTTATEAANIRRSGTRTGWKRSVRCGLSARVVTAMTTPWRRR
jgi:hypothetical protein